MLIQNAGGGVGLAAIDLAKHIGAVTIGTASTKKHDLLRAKGLDNVIGYDNIKVDVMRLTGIKGVDLIIDPIGGASWSENYKLLRAGGRLGCFGASTITAVANVNLFSKLVGLAGFALKIPLWTPLKLMGDNKAVFGVNLGHMWDDERLRPWLTEIVSGPGEGGWVTSHVDRVFSFAEITKAQDYIEGRANIGKVIIVPTQPDAEVWAAAHSK